MSQTGGAGTGETSITIGLMRHAKSGWDDPQLADHDRPLNARGRRDAPRMAKWLAENRFLPEVILGSTAERVRQTITGLLDVWTHEPCVWTSSTLYLASAGTLREHLMCEAVLPDGRRPKTVLLIAHNPGIESLASYWAGGPTRMPTAAVVIFQCEPLRPEDLTGPCPRRMLALGRPKEIDLPPGDEKPIERQGSPTDEPR